jgi:TPR repeat protein
MEQYGRPKMKMKILWRGICLTTALTGVIALSPVQAQDYNKGLLAAEAGDYTTAVQTWGPLASEGNSAAQFNIALMYHSGLGVPADEAKAVEWYRRSAENGYTKAQEFLAAAYREGWFGLPQDSQKAAYWDKRLGQ